MAFKTETVDDLFARFGKHYLVLVTVSGMTASFVMVLSGTIVNVAIPDVMGAYGVGQYQAQLLATSFNVAMTTCQLLNAWVVAVLGQRYGYIATLIFFTAGSIIAGLADSFGMLIAGRVMQGMATGIIQPLIMVTVFQVFPKERRGFALGIYSMGLVLAIALGPPVGGVALEFLNWRYIFWLPLPLLLIALPLGIVFMPSVRRLGGQAFDWVGYILIAVTLFCIMTVLTDGPRKGWTSDHILILGMLGIVCGFGFVKSQRRDKETLIDISLFTNKHFVIVLFVTFFSGIGNFASTYAFPVFTQLVQGLSPLDAGFSLLPGMLLAVCLVPFTGHLADKLEPGKAMMFGLLILGIGTLPMAWADVNTPLYIVMIYGAIGRFGSTFVQPFLMNTALRSVPPEKLNAGAGTVNFIRQTGGSLGTNAWVVFVDQRTFYHSEGFTLTQNPSNSSSRELISGVTRLLNEAGVSEAIQQLGALHYLSAVIYAQGITRAFQDGFMILAIAYLIAVIPAWILSQTRAK
ncbi:MAG: DHA2 family efflux MFS transporter permease subunit [Alphaproteobacteria bacterium]|jgi:DHA2 family multidrug resistance protein